MTDYKKEQKYNYQIERILLEDSKKRRISSMDYYSMQNIAQKQVRIFVNYDRL